ncbi:MAG: PAS domain-containing protein, partial [Chthoniobacterales bacterium]
MNASILFEESEQRGIAADITGQIQRARVIGNLLIGLAILAIIGTAVAMIRMVRGLREDKRTLRTEVDEHEQTEQALREGEARYRLLVDHSPDGILVVCEGKIVFANPAFLEMLGAKGPDQLIGRSSSHIVHPDERHQIADRARELAAGGQPPVAERRLLRLDGSICEVESSVILFLYEGKTAQQVIVRDCTGRRAAQKQLREAEEKYRSIFENAAEGIFQNTPEGAFLSANPALAQMLGFDSPEELIRERHDLEQLGYAEPAKRGEFKRLLEEKGFVNDFEYQALRRDGSTLWVSENVRIVRNAAGKALYYEGSVRDITERKHSEDEMRRSAQRFRSFTTATA